MGKVWFCMMRSEAERIAHTLSWMQKILPNPFSGYIAQPRTLKQKLSLYISFLYQRKRFQGPLGSNSLYLNTSGASEINHPVQRWSSEPTWLTRAHRGNGEGKMSGFYESARTHRFYSFSSMYAHAHAHAHNRKTPVFPIEFRRCPPDLTSHISMHIVEQGESLWTQDPVLNTHYYYATYPRDYSVA